MRIILMGMAFATVMSASASADWQRQGTTTGPRGKTVHSEGTGSCGNGRCEWSRQTEGPRGNNATTSGTATRTAPGELSRSATTSGSGGQTVKREGTFHVVR